MRSETNSRPTAITDVTANAADFKHKVRYQGALDDVARGYAVREEHGALAVLNLFGSQPLNILRVHVTCGPTICFTVDL